MVVKIKENDFRLLATSAFRYGLGRKTSFIEDIIELIITHSSVFHSQDYKDFLDGIKFQKELRDLGYGCSIESQIKFEDFCKIKIKELDKK